MSQLGRRELGPLQHELDKRWFTITLLVLTITQEFLVYLCILLLKVFLFYSFHLGSASLSLARLYSLTYYYKAPLRARLARLISAFENLDDYDDDNDDSIT
jgi:hypothetical protein